MSYLFRILLIVVSVTQLVTGCSTRETEKPTASRKAGIGNVLATTTLLATITADDKPQSIAPPSGLGIHPSPANMFQFIFSERGGGVAYVVEKDGTSRMVHNGAAGKSYQTVGDVVLSPDGKRIAYGALVDGKWRMVVDGKEGAPFNTVRLPRFSPDGAHLAYQAMAGERWHLVVDGTPNAGTLKRYLPHEFSADSSRIACIDDVDDNNRGRLVVSDLAFATQTVVGSGVSFMLANADKSRIAAVSTMDGKQRVIDFSLDRPESVNRGAIYDTVGALAFGPDGVTLAYPAERAGRRLLVVGNRELALPDGDMAGLPVIHPDKKTVAVPIFSGGMTFLHQLSPVGGIGEVGHGYEAVEGLVYGRDGRFHAYAAQKGETWFVVVNGKEGPTFDRVVSPKFSPDGKLLVYRARKDGKRFVVVADMTARTIKAHPAYEQVFDAVFTADGKSVAYGVKDGNRLIWKVEAL